MDMMIFYSGLTKLKTKPIVFQDEFPATDPGTLERLKDLTAKRKAIEDSMDEKTHLTDAIAREVSGGLTSHCQQNIQKLEHYIPLLDNLISHSRPKGKTRQMNTWISNLNIRWASALIPTSSSSIFQKGPKFIQVNDLRFEQGMILYLYGSMLRERAMEVLSSDVVQSAKLFRQAAGVYNYIGDKVYLHLSESAQKLPETRIASTMATICLAEAQAVTAIKAESNNSTCSLLARLHCGIIDLLSGPVKTLQSTAKERCNPLSRLLDYILSCKTLHGLQCSKHFAKGLQDEGKIGAAIGVVRRALENAKRSVPKDDTWRSIYKQTVDDLGELLRKYEHENEFVWHDKIPCNDDLPLPQGANIVNPIPYVPHKVEEPLSFNLRSN